MLQMQFANLITNQLEPIKFENNLIGKLLVVLGAGPWQTSGIQSAKKLGLRVLAIDIDKEAVGFGFADYKLAVDPNDTTAIIQYLKQTFPEQPIGIVAFVTDALQLAAAKLREHLSISGPSVDITRRMTDKTLQRQCWQDNGISNPDWFVFDSVEEAIGFFKKNRLCDYIIKPSTSSGSRGITVVKVSSSFDDIRVGVSIAFQYSNNRKIIIERFIKGVEYTIETFTHHNTTHILAISEKRKVPGTCDTVAIELASPSISDIAQAEIGQLAKSALFALGYHSGPAHTEILRTSEGRLFLVESAGRGGGFMVADGIVPIVSNFDLHSATILSALGCSFDFPPPTMGACFVLRFIPSMPGVVKSINGFEEANQLDDLIAEPIIKVNEKCGSPGTDAGRLAYILAYGKHRSDVLDKADKAEKYIKFELNT